MLSSKTFVLASSSFHKLASTPGDMLHSPKQAQIIDQTKWKGKFPKK